MGLLVSSRTLLLHPLPLPTDTHCQTTLTPSSPTSALRAIIIMPCINNASQYINNASLQHGWGGEVVVVVAAEGGGGVQTVFSWLSISYHNRAFTSSLTFNPSLCFRTPIKGLLTLSAHSDLCVLGACVGSFVSASVCVCVCG